MSSVSRRSALLIDSFKRVHNYLRISLTERCNLRCQYCMPEKGVELSPANHILNTNEILRLVRIFTEHGGINKIRLTGGGTSLLTLKPTIRKDLVDIVHGIRSYPSMKTIGITTNGVLLHRLLKPLAQAGLNSLNISLDSLVAEKFEFLTRRAAFTRVLTNIRLALDIPNLYPLVKINCVVMQGVNTDELTDFVELTRDQPNLAVRFIEYMPFSDNKWSNKKYFPYEEMLKIIKQEYDLEKLIQEDKNDTTKWYRVKDNAYSGKVGFITSMSEHFCSTCNRVRVTADGQLKVCLFDNKEVSLRDALRSGLSDEEIYSLIQRTLYKKEKEHLSVDILSTQENRPMILIGG
ncbi:unnamed protein product [Rotaria magnacalcarata]|uniref:GTP 3',8-cyclase n=1 Tax=Rotaria magnacalcarata TaxID=392030 RepID=A0A819UW04_9BILA|nr:unnamed protein product [Rotaria magnacalcarata]CAF3910872.1 unnamed protein product [Rotaria magnacalcarata]CAF3915579.1 unnamed protein product [Rotaria magnacalcarata]CAF4101718.1 unnamed protein product [Rotaria magnacalcarata]